MIAYEKEKYIHYLDGKTENNLSLRLFLEQPWVKLLNTKNMDLIKINHKNMILKDIINNTHTDRESFSCIINEATAVRYNIKN